MKKAVGIFMAVMITVMTACGCIGENSITGKELLAVKFGQSEQDMDAMLALFDEIGMGEIKKAEIDSVHGNVCSAHMWDNGGREYAVGLTDGIPYLIVMKEGKDRYTVLYDGKFDEKDREPYIRKIG